MTRTRAAIARWNGPLVAAAVACLQLPQGCAEPVSTGAAELSAAGTDLAVDVRPVRVRIVSGAEQVQVRGEGPMAVHDEEASVVLPAGQWLTLAASQNGGVIPMGGSEAAPEWTLSAPDSGALWLFAVEVGRPMPARPYPGRLRVTAGDRGGVAVVNEVDLEEYVACVAARETWPSAPAEAYRAQAVAIRSYVLHWMRRRRDHPFDVSNDQWSQVYTGRVSGQAGVLAREAADSTRGVVCVTTCDGQPLVLPAYYSAACGGWTQAMAAFGGGEPLLSPLAGGVSCSFCRRFDESDLTWGDTTTSMATLFQRLRPILPDSTARTPPIDIQAVRSGDSPRPVAYRLVWPAAVSEPIPAERFRTAVGVQLMRSTLCRVAVNGGEIEFCGGRGAGHGVGLCQRGACVMAREGRTAAEILHFYYPGISLARAY